MEPDFCNYATISDLKNATGFDPSTFVKEVRLAILTSDFDKLDIIN